MTDPDSDLTDSVVIIRDPNDHIEIAKDHLTVYSANPLFEIIKRRWKSWSELNNRPSVNAYSMLRGRDSNDQKFIRFTLSDTAQKVLVPSVDRSEGFRQLWTNIKDLILVELLCILPEYQ